MPVSAATRVSAAAAPSASSARSAASRASAASVRPAASSRRVSWVAVLRLGRSAVVGVAAALILVGGVWASWRTAPYVMLTKGRERGAVEVTSCHGDVCAGRFTPVSQGARVRERVRVEGSAAVRRGRTYSVVVLPGGDEVVRSGPAGVLYAWVPLGGALLLASVVVGGGLRWTRVAWVMAGSGLVLVTVVFVVV